MLVQGCVWTLAGVDLQAYGRGGELCRVEQWHGDMPKP